MTSTPQFQTLAVTIDQRVATVCLQRPDKANAIDASTWEELERCFSWLDDEASVRVVVLTGAGKHFCAGIDLAFLAALAAQLEHREDARRSEFLRREILALQGRLTAIERCRKPVLAAVHSTCVGAGLDMIACCDMRYCSADARFSIKEIELGMTADLGTLQRLPRLIGDGLVRELAYTGRAVDAGEALSSGLVNRIFADKSALLTGVAAIARDIAEKSPLAIRGTKEMLLYNSHQNIRDGLNYVATWNAGMLSTSDVMRAVAAAHGKAVDFDD